MIKLYKREKDNSLRYAEYWIDDTEIILHTGKVGRQGKVQKYSLGKDFDSEESFVSFFLKNMNP